MLVIEVVVGILAKKASYGANDCAWNDVGAAAYVRGGLV
jgi:hypothetical protein